MTSSAPVLAVDPYAILFDDNIWRDALRKPLFSTGGINKTAIAPELALFGYALGGTVAGGGNGAGFPATEWHTNMKTPQRLDEPKKMRVDGVRLYMPQITWSSSNVPALSDPTFDAANAQDAELLEDLLLIHYNCMLWLRIGEKDYINHPLWLLPANVGYNGIAAVANDRVSGAAIGNVDTTLVHSIGKGFRFDVYPFLIEKGQSILSKLLCPWNATLPALNDDRVVTVFLDGNIYREIS
jgi:hypothetical protein